MLPAARVLTRSRAYRRGPIGRIAGVLVVLTGCVLTGCVLAGCAAGAAPPRTDHPSEPDVPAVRTVTIDGALHHVHGIVVADDGTLLVGTHSGVAALTPDGTVTRVGEGRDDHMGLTGVPGTDELLSSGHPGPGSTLPNPLGLMGSDDGGETWTPLSLTGEVDFHALATDGSLVVGHDSRAGLLVSEDAGATFVRGALVAAAALAIRGSEVYAATRDGLHRSTDSGMTFSPVPDSPLLVLVAGGSDGSLWGVDVEGRAWRSADGTSWKERGRVGPVEALGVADLGTAYAVRDGTLSILS